MLDTACNGTLTADWQKNASVKISEVLKDWEQKRLIKYEEDCYTFFKSKPNTKKLSKMQALTLMTGFPESWIGMTLESACIFIVDCPHSTPKFTENGQYCIDTTCIEPSKIIWSKARKVSDTDFISRTARMTPYENDIFFAREGTIGTVVRVPPNTKICLGQRIMMFRFAPFVSPGFAELFMQSTMFVNQYRPLILGTSSPHLNVQDIRKLTIVIPPLEEQKEIEHQLSIKLSIKYSIDNDIDKSLKKVEILRQSILKSAFEGKLVSQDPSDEPASMLL